MSCVIYHVENHKISLMDHFSLKAKVTFHNSSDNASDLT